MKPRAIHILLTGLLAFGSISYAADDISADTRAFAVSVSRAPGVILRVPVDGQGREDSSATELRLATSPVTDASNIAASFVDAAETSSVPQLSGNDIAKDSSTCGFFAYQNPWGWMPSYYYLTYTPVYYHAGQLYQFSAPVVYTAAPVFGYRYYYYPRYFL